LIKGGSAAVKTISKIEKLGRMTPKLTGLVTKLTPLATKFGSVSLRIQRSLMRFIDSMGQLFIRGLIQNMLMNQSTDQNMDTGLTLFGGLLTSSWALSLGLPKSLRFALFAGIMYETALRPLNKEYWKMTSIHGITLDANAPTSSCSGMQGFTLGHQSSCRNSDGSITWEFFDFLRYAAIEARQQHHPWSPLAADILSVTAIVADLDYLTARYFVNKAGFMMDVAFENHKFANGMDNYYLNESGFGLDFNRIGLGISTMMGPVYLTDWRESWMYDDNYREQYNIKRTYNFAEAILVEYGYQNI
jgi:hypothetical protein